MYGSFIGLIFGIECGKHKPHRWIKSAVKLKFIEQIYKKTILLMMCLDKKYLFYLIF